MGVLSYTFTSILKMGITTGFFFSIQSLRHCTNTALTATVMLSFHQFRQLLLLVTLFILCDCCDLFFTALFYIQIVLIWKGWIHSKCRGPEKELNYCNSGHCRLNSSHGQIWAKRDLSKKCGQAGAAEPPGQPGQSMRTVGQAYVSDPPILWMVIQFRRSILLDFSTNNYQSVKKNFVVSSHTHFAIIHCHITVCGHIIHANFYVIWLVSMNK